MSYLILVKHAMPEIVEGVPSACWRLSPGGREAAAAFARELHAYTPIRVFSSPEPKACETAEIMAQHLGLPSQSRDGLEEHHRHAVPFLDDGGFREAVRDCFEDPDSLVFGTETANEASARFGSAMNGIDGEVGDASVAVVAHGTVISLYVASLTGIDPFSLWERLGLPSCVVISRGDAAQVEVISRSCKDCTTKHSTLSARAAEA